MKCSTMFVMLLCRELRAEPDHFNASSDKMDRVLAPRFQILNLVPESTQVLMEDLETSKFLFPLVF